MAQQFLDRAKMTVSGTPGTGVITLNAAVAGYQTFAQAGILDGGTMSYVIEDGTNFEIGIGTYAASGTTLTRTTVIASSASGAAITATSSAIVYSDVLAEDIAALKPAPVTAVVSTAGVTGSNGNGIAYTTYRMHLTSTYGGGASAYSFAEVAMYDAAAVKQAPTSATASASYSGQPASQGIDNNTSSQWGTSNGGDGSGFTFDILYPTPFVIGGLSITSDSDNDQAPSTLTVYGSNDGGTTFTQVTTKLTFAAWSRSTTQTIAIPTPPVELTPAIVQQGAFAGAGSAAVVLGASPTPGNLLVAVGTHYTSGPAIGAGWQVIAAISVSADDTTTILTKLVTSLDAMSDTVTPFTDSAGCTAVVFELENVISQSVSTTVLSEFNGTTCTINTAFPAKGGISVGAIACTQSTTLPTIAGVTTGASATGTGGSAGPRGIQGFSVISTARGALDIVGTVGSSENLYAIAAVFAGVG